MLSSSKLITCNACVNDKVGHKLCYELGADIKNSYFEMAIYSIYMPIALFTSQSKRSIVYT